MTITCHCGKTREVKPSDAARGAKFCSDPCARADRARTARQAAEDAWNRVDTSGLHWPFTGATQSAGYGHVKMNGEWKLLSHIAWFLATGHWPVKGEVVLHTLDCGHEACCRNDVEGTYTLKDGTVLPRWGHLALGTHPNNNADKIDKERQARGEQSNHSNLTDADILDIRTDAAAGETLVSIAHRKGVTPAAIWNIVRGKTWKHVGGKINSTPRQAKKLTTEDAMGVLADAEAGMKQVAIARKRGISEAQVSLIVNRKSWRHLP